MDNQTETDKKKSDDCKKEKKILCLWFCVVYLTTLLIFSLTWRSATASTEVINMISVGSGLASIALALAAAYHAYTQSGISSENNNLMQSNLTKISGKVVELDEISDKLTQFRQDFLDHIQIVNASLQQIKNGYEQFNSLIPDLTAQIHKQGLIPGNEQWGQQTMKIVNQAQSTIENSTKAFESIEKVAASPLSSSITVFRKDSTIIERSI